MTELVCILWGALGGLIISSIMIMLFMHHYERMYVAYLHAKNYFNAYNGYRYLIAKIEKIELDLQDLMTDEFKNDR